MDLTRDELQPRACWFAVDHVAGQPAVTEFKRRARLHQAEWRDAQGYPRGFHRTGDEETPNGSKLRPEEGAHGVNFLSDSIRKAVEHRLSNKQKGQQLNRARLENDLLSSMPMCFNLFGELYGRSEALLDAGKRLFGIDSPGPAELRFEWSPERHSPDYTNDGTAFDAAIVFGPETEPRQVIGIETKYHEHATKEARPNESTRLPRYREITERSDVFHAGWQDQILGTDLQQIWRDHILLLAMLQRPAEWSGGRYILVYPSGNPSFRDAGERYRKLLRDDSTFDLMTVEALLDGHLLHDENVERDFRARYLW